MNTVTADFIRDTIATDAAPGRTVLLVAPSADTPGGVAAYASGLRNYLKTWNVCFLAVGRHEREPILSTLWRLIRVPVRVALAVRRNRIDVIHLNPSLNARSLLRDGLILLALRLVRFRRTLVSFHGWQPATESVVKKPLIRTVFRWLLNGCACVTVLAPSFKASLEKLGVRHVHMARALFDGALFESMPCAAQTIAPKRRSILFMSRLVRQKGIYELLDAFIALADDFPDVDLIIAGSGEEHALLHMKVIQSGLAGRIRMTGHVTGSEKGALLQQCTVFALPSYYPEGMPVALLEAMAAGKPLLTSAAGGIAGIASEPDSGRVLNAVTRDTVEAGLRALLNDPDHCAHAGRRNAQAAWAEFEASRVAAQIEALYLHIRCAL